MLVSPAMTTPPQVSGTGTANSVSVYKEPVIPNKYDIIPIHNSDRAAFKRCRRYWNWSSPARDNLTLRADIYGVNTNLWFGTGIHWALEQYYNPLLQRDPVEAWKTWFDIQWRGGTVTEEWLDRVYDLNPRKLPDTDDMESLATLAGNGLYQVRGLEDIIPDPDTSEFDELFELGINMMEYYKEYAAKNDDFTVVLVEHDFSVPIWDYENQRIFTAVDMREDSPNYGKELEVHARGRTDAVLQSSINGKLRIHDYKTAATISEDYFRKLETDEQCTHYLWALEVEASYYDLPHKGEPIEEVTYTALRKTYPKQPTMLKNGMFSIARESESCTYEILQKWIAVHLPPPITLTEKQQGYLDWLRDVGDEQFIIRKHVRRNRHQIANSGRRLYLEAKNMLSPEIDIYPTISNDYMCLNCQFRPPCLAAEDGSDYEQMLRDNYTKNKDR